MSGAEANSTRSASIDHEVEAVHFATAIQPHGVLLVLSDPELNVLQVSANTAVLWGLAPQNLLGQPLQRFLDTQQAIAIQQSLPAPGVVDFPRLSIQTSNGSRWFDGRLYRSDSGFLLELEPSQDTAQSTTLSLNQLRQTIDRLKRAAELPEFLQRVTEEIRAMTGFDRVMLYQFDAQGAGAVVAEASRQDLSPYLGLHYPATDIPEAVRALYGQGLLRYIPDLKAQPAALIPAEHPMTQHPSDLSRSLLRSVDPCCVEYHQNMQVSAMLVISLVKDQALWGLISCHHQTAKFLSGEVRTACELLGEFTASELFNKVDQAELSALHKLKLLQAELVEAISQATNFREALIHPAPRLLDLVNAQGAAICLDEEITLVGATPTVEQVRGLRDWVNAQDNDQSNEPLFHTDMLPRLYPEAMMFKETGSGLLRLQISQVRRYSILWFRPEVLRTINWAGDPQTSRQVQPDGQVKLCPRRSFEQWQETVQLTALPWQPYELNSALELRSAIVGIVLNKADELTLINRELERSNQELDSFIYAASHDLKEPLRGIHNYSTLLLKGYADVLDDTGKNRLHTLLRLTRRMELLIDVLLKFSRLGQTTLQVQAIDLNPLVQQVLADLQISRQEVSPTVDIPRTLPIVRCDAVLLQEVFMNLLSNALKYTDKTQPWIEIGYVEAAASTQQRHPSPILYVRDNGIGIRDRHRETIFRLFKRLHEQHLYGGGTGTGLTIAKKIIDRHGGRIWVESTYGEGSTFYFTLS